MQSHDLGWIDWLAHNIRLTVDEGKERLKPSREKNEVKHRRRKMEKSCVAFLLCDPGWYVHKPDVQNKWDDNTHTHMHIHISKACTLSPPSYIYLTLYMYIKLHPLPRLLVVGLGGLTMGAGVYSAAPGASSHRKGLQAEVRGREAAGRGFYENPYRHMERYQGDTHVTVTFSTLLLVH